MENRFALVFVVLILFVGIIFSSVGSDNISGKFFLFDFLSRSSGDINEQPLIGEPKDIGIPSTEISNPAATNSDCKTELKVWDVGKDRFVNLDIWVKFGKTKCEQLQTGITSSRPYVLKCLTPKKMDVIDCFKQGFNSCVTRNGVSTCSNE